MNPLIQPAALKERLGQSGLVLLDATYFLPSENQDAQTGFATTHLPNAQFFDVDKICNTASSLPHMLPTPEAFAKAVSAMGIGDDTHVVVYDQRGIFSAPRVWWMFRVFGHDNVQVLDGGLPAWLALNGETQSGAPRPATPAHFTTRFRAEMVRSLEQMQTNLTSHAEKVLDARGAARFHAHVPEPRAGMKGGHIPGSINIPFTCLLENGRYLPAPQLKQVFVDSGINDTSSLIASCGSGITACVVTLGLVLAGLPEAAIYDGSWSEWGGRDDTPIEV